MKLDEDLTYVYIYKTKEPEWYSITQLSNLLLY